MIDFDIFIDAIQKAGYKAIPYLPKVMFSNIVISTIFKDKDHCMNMIHNQIVKKFDHVTQVKELEEYIYATINVKVVQNDGESIIYWPDVIWKNYSHT
jgi:hypothetical protein